MSAVDRPAPNLELALLQRSVGVMEAERIHCHRCRRSPLIGERIYRCEGGRALCELCRTLDRRPIESEQIVHGPEFGHSIRILDRRSV